VIFATRMRHSWTVSTSESYNPFLLITQLHHSLIDISIVVSVMVTYYA
jgi:hypothetical protein